MSLAKVMLVDDEKDFVRAMARRLSMRNFDIVTAHSGEEALAVLEQDSSIEVIVLDVKMPGIDGITTLRKIKDSYPEVQVIMLTAHATVESALDGMTIGAFDYLMKPADMKDLIEKITSAATFKRHKEE